MNVYSLEKELPELPLEPPPRNPMRLAKQLHSPTLHNATPSIASSQSSYSDDPANYSDERVERLEKEKRDLRSEVNRLQRQIRRHEVDIVTRTALLRRQNSQLNKQIERQNQFMTNLVNTVFTVFSDYKQAVGSLKQFQEDEIREEPSGDEIRVYNEMDGNWI
ncbi:hypothetical protein PFICI_05950 [Pestalotiopsis fici W106-1]|uniref:Uncharacterized protein n=1 Tax=Pestalotiopsis fici (strain W106-1 / CGMCC3.15140) TaxID=1229662 RepID=W3XDH7_PESFW|nr:uncharacterized protein PFICI_05950 [Pestalotiopsis fici W106-1]ETS84074.1 hypothetical protein PFICI_05950 [Pestalotiopsis fici W106-1]